MSRRLSPRRFVCLWLIGLWCHVVTHCDAQPGPAVGWTRPAHWLPTSTEGQRTYKNVASCAYCHRLDPNCQPGESGNPVVEGIIRKGSRDRWYCGNELSTWSIHDRHAKSAAMLSLEHPVTKQMAEIMQIDQPALDRRCVACHTSLPIWEPGLADDTNPTIALSSLDELQRDLVNVGVSCESCHGPSGGSVGDGQTVSGWFEAHQTIGKLSATTGRWRYLDATTRSETYGLVNLRSPKTQAEMCLSCHLGETTLKRVVTHEMYAAGHPPLGGFSLDTYREQMPRHWMMLQEKPAEVREEFLKQTQSPQYPYPRTRLMVIGAATAMQQYALLLADTAGQTDLRFTQHAGFVSEENDPSPFWPELAHYECYACHHDLTSASWRQLAVLDKTRPRVPSGRPVLRDWCVQLARIAQLAHPATAPDTPATTQSLAFLLRTQAFGPPAYTSALAREVNAANERLATDWETLADTAWTPDLMTELLRGLVEYGAEAHLEYDAARDLAWAIDTILLEAGDKLANSRQMKSKLDQLQNVFHFQLNMSENSCHDPLAAAALTNGKQAVPIPMPATSPEAIEISPPPLWPLPGDAPHAPPSFPWRGVLDAIMPLAADARPVPVTVNLRPINVVTVFDRANQHHPESLQKTCQSLLLLLPEK
jgi:hypothetical protein